MTVPGVPLNTGAEIPQLGLGTARVRDDHEIRRIVATALEVGYRHVDTAASYDNEVGVGQGLADSGLPRDEVFVTTKLRGSQQGADTRVALEQSLERLGLDHVDLYLIHWPLPRLDRYVESWLVMEELAAEGLTRAIGVSNFLPEHLDRLAAASSTVPAVNQIELHPREPQLAQRADDARRGIVTEAWSPLTNAGDLLRVPDPGRDRRAPRQDPGAGGAALARAAGHRGDPEGQPRRPPAAEPRRLRLHPVRRGPGGDRDAGDREEGQRPGPAHLGGVLATPDPGRITRAARPTRIRWLTGRTTPWERIWAEQRSLTVS